jgi:alkyl hydroperoxide reductase subunit D
MNESTEIINEILTAIGVDTAYRTESLTLLEKGESRYLRDLKLNFTSTLTSEHLSTKECALLGLSVAVNNNNTVLTQYFTRYATEQGATAVDVAEAAGCASLLAANNVFYRFRHFTQKGKIHTNTCTYPHAANDETGNR